MNDRLFSLLSSLTEGDKIRVDDCTFTFEKFGAPIYHMGLGVYVVQVTELQMGLYVGPISDIRKED